MFRHGDLPLAMADLIVISNGGFGGCYERESVGWERERERARDEEEERVKQIVMWKIKNGL